MKFLPIWGSLYFQNGVSFLMEYLIFFHDGAMLIMVMIMVLVGYILINSMYLSLYNLGLFEGQGLEMIWTVLPGLFLLFIAFPSLRLLYLMEEEDFYEMTISLMGYQWYWSYEYSDLIDKTFDSYLKDSSESVFRLLDVDNSLIVPIKTNLRVVVSSSDVIHSWTIPSLGVKVDAVPGRLNQLFMVFDRVGVFFGQCSEICGANHSFMPIKLVSVPREVFIDLLM